MCYKKKTFIILLFLNGLTNKNTCRRIQSFTEFFFYGSFKIFYIFLHSFFLINFNFYYNNAFFKIQSFFYKLCNLHFLSYDYNFLLATKYWLSPPYEHLNFIGIYFEGKNISIKHIPTNSVANNLPKIT